MILSVCHLWIVGLWAVMLAYWAIAALFTKRTVDRGLGGGGLLVRIGLACAVVASVILARRSAELQAFQIAELRSVPMAIAGALVATAGAAVAFTARAVIGRNWGTPGSRKADTDLVTSGPYQYIRHPIYSGVLLMMAGTAVGLIPTWWFAFAAAAAYFFYSARREEGLMTERFPDAYPAYRARTRMFVPFVV
jgi:protein-S-isoprenylcysteine O-methyltransferase Ste14